MTELYVANTDNNWFDFLRARQPWEEVNFWKPSKQIFKAIDEGGLFVFRLKAPRNKIGGYGILVSSINAPIKLAWDSLGEANGVPSLETLVTAIARYRTSRDTTEHSLIGCRLISNPVFFAEDEWFDVPSSWANSIVQGKTYNTHSDEGLRLMQQLEERLRPEERFRRDRGQFEAFEEEAPRFGKPISLTPRLGQGSFRIKVASVYNFSCSVSETKVLPALDAAHIKPYGKGGTHKIENGILFRKDIHSVFDSGFATVDEQYRFIVSSKIKDVFNNGNEYRRLHGQKLLLPGLENQWPSKENLEWHRNNCFVGG